MRICFQHWRKYQFIEKIFFWSDFCRFRPGSDFLGIDLDPPKKSQKNKNKKDIFGGSKSRPKNGHFRWSKFRPV